MIAGDSVRERVRTEARQHKAEERHEVPGKDQVARDHLEGDRENAGYQDLPG